MVSMNPDQVIIMGEVKVSVTSVFRKNTQLNLTTELRVKQGHI